MIVLSGALVLVALVLLVFGALDRNLPYVYASIGVSVLSLALLLVGVLQRRGELAGDDDEATTAVTDTSAERVPALAGAGHEPAHVGQADGEGHTAELAVPGGASAPPPASRRVATDARPVEDAPELRQDEDPHAVEQDVDDEALEEAHVEGEEPGDEHEGFEDSEDEDEDFEDEAEDFEDEGEDDAEDEDEDEDAEDEVVGAGSGVTVLVVSGRPRYHLEGCRVLRGKQAQPLDRDDARTHGFSPCGVCKPDADETPAPPVEPDAGTSAAADDGTSFTQALFGERLFADPSPQDRDQVATSELPDRPVQPALPDVEPAVVSADDVEAPSPLRGDDPADDPTDDPGVLGAAEPAPDLAANPDELAEDGPRSADASTDEPAVEEPVQGLPAGLTGDEEDTSAAVDGPDETAAAEPVSAPTTAPAVTGPATVDDDLAEQAPARKTVTKATSRKAPAKRAPAKKAPAKKAPAKKAPAKKAPAEQAAEQAPAKTSPARKRSTAPAAKAAPAPAPAPQVKRPAVRTVRADALRPGAPTSAVTTTRVAVRAAAPSSASAPVVVVPDRDRFHRPECRFVRDVAGATSLAKASATRQGYVSCGVCKP